MDHRHFMQAALAEARLAFDKGEVPIGAVVVCDGKIIGCGHNLRESNADPTAHAEVLAIRAAAQRQGHWRLEDCTLYVTLEPCIMCSGAIVLARLARLVYGARDPKAGAVDSLYRLVEDPRLNHRAEVIGGILEGECAAILKEFFQDLRQK